MHESAFVDPPWLLEREGSGYVQVTRLLHQIAEHANGENTVEDIAARISESGTPVSPATVQGLVARLLVPRGLVEAPDGSVAAAPNATPSPLALNMKMHTVRPETVEPITTVLRWLFLPPVMIAFLLAAFLAEAWLYVVHGVGGSVRDTLYAPASMLLILGVVVLAAGFHELGHAAALHFAGGRTKGMGVGIYTVYPAFYTDVSDNYRLRRWARVRTDLGGFYFNLVFVLGILGLYALTGREFLLLVVLLINFEVIHQLLPFLRLDGYWALADITGIPDFFSMTGAFLRSIAPVPAWRNGRRLPPLKWWGKAVFIAYLLVSIPMLVLLLVLMIKSVPRVLATAWDSSGQQLHALQQAAGGGDVLGMVAAIFQLLILAIPIVGLLYTLYALARRGFGALWAWSRPTPGRRVVGTVGTLAAVGLVAFLWAPQLPSLLPAVGGQPGPLYSQTRFEPIQPEERGTLADVVAPASTRPPASTPGAGTPTSVATPLRTATALAGTPAPAQGTPGAAGTATAQSQVTPAAVATATPVSRSGTPTTPAGGTATPRAVATPGAIATPTP